MRKKADKKSKIKSAVALLSILMIGGLAVEVGIAGLFIVYALGQSGFGVRLSSEALAAAQSGLEDSFLKILRNKNYPSGTYVINVNNRTAQVAICKDSKTITAPCDTPNIGKDEITSLGTAVNKSRKIRAFVNVQSVTGEVDVESVSELKN